MCGIFSVDSNFLACYPIGVGRPTKLNKEKNGALPLTHRPPQLRIRSLRSPAFLRFWQRVGMAVKPDFGPKVDIYGMKCTEPIGGRDPHGEGADTTSICVGFFVLSKKLIAP